MYSILDVYRIVSQPPRRIRTSNLHAPMKYSSVHPKIESFSWKIISCGQAKRKHRLPNRVHFARLVTILNGSLFILVSPPEASLTVKAIPYSAHGRRFESQLAGDFHLERGVRLSGTPPAVETVGGIYTPRVGQLQRGCPWLLVGDLFNSKVPAGKIIESVSTY